MNRITAQAPCVWLAVIVPSLVPTAVQADREYNPTHRRFQQRDPARYVDGLNHYAATRSNPTHFTDSTGTTVQVDASGPVIVLRFSLVFWGQSFDLGGPGGQGDTGGGYPTDVHLDLDAWNEIAYQGRGVYRPGSGDSRCRALVVRWSPPAPVYLSAVFTDGFPPKSCNGPNLTSSDVNDCYNNALAGAGLAPGPGVVSVWVKSPRTCSGGFCGGNDDGAGDPNSNRVRVNSEQVDSTAYPNLHLFAHEMGHVMWLPDQNGGAHAGHMMDQQRANNPAATTRSAVYHEIVDLANLNLPPVWYPCNRVGVRPVRMNYNVNNSEAVQPLQRGRIP